MVSGISYFDRSNLENARKLQRHAATLTAVVAVGLTEFGGAYAKQGKLNLLKKSCYVGFGLLALDLCLRKQPSFFKNNPVASTPAVAGSSSAAKPAAPPVVASPSSSVPFSEQDQIERECAMIIVQNGATTKPDKEYCHYLAELKVKKQCKSLDEKLFKQLAEQMYQIQLEKSGKPQDAFFQMSARSTVIGDLEQLCIGAAWLNRVFD